MTLGSEHPDEIVAYVDGGSRGNPGPAGYGVRIEGFDGTAIEEFSASIGVATNNVAEYRGLLAALEWARAHECDRVHVRSDSLLLVQQMLGNYKVKNTGLQPLHAKARLLALEIGHVTFEHVGRAFNAHADRLANQAMDDAVSSRRSSVTSRESSVEHLATSGPHAGAASVQNVAQEPDQKAKPHPFSAVERAVRLFIYRHFLDTSTAPDVGTIARRVDLSERDVTAALHRLADGHAIVLAPSTTSIWMAHPFSAVPSAYPVEANGRTYWANCAWDAAGILSMVGGDGESRTQCADCGESIAMTIRGGRIIGAGVVHYLVPPRRFWENVAYT